MPELPYIEDEAPSGALVCNGPVVRGPMLPDVLCPIDVGTGEEVAGGVVVAAVSRHEQADEIWEGESWH